MAISVLQWLCFGLWTQWAMGQGWMTVMVPSRTGILFQQLVIEFFIFFPVTLFTIYSIVNYILRPLAQLQQWTIAPPPSSSLQQFRRCLFS